MSGTPNRIDPFQPAGDLIFTIASVGEDAPVSGYRRTLGMSDAVVTETRNTGKARITIQTIASLDAPYVIVRAVCSSGRIGGRFSLRRAEDAGCALRFDRSAEMLRMRGSFSGGIDFEVRAMIRAQGGKVSFAEDGGLEAEDAEEILVFLDIGTSAGGDAPEKEISSHRVPDLPWEEPLRRHTARFRHFYDRVLLRLGKENGVSTGLITRAFNLARYLLICCNTGELPAHLQGKWDEDLNPMFGADYHNDINIQMCHWLTECCGMPELAEPLFSYMEKLVPHGRKAAQDLYGCRGVYVPITTDSWFRATPESYGWAVWTGGAAWLSRHLWEHWLFDQNEDFLRYRAYPYFREAARFYEDYLTEGKNGEIQIVPSQSPENRFRGSGDLPVSICVSSAADVTLCRDALTFAVESARILHADRDEAGRWQNLIDRLPPLRIGADGRILEWAKNMRSAIRDTVISCRYTACFPAIPLRRKHRNCSRLLRKPSLIGWNTASRPIPAIISPTSGGHSSGLRAVMRACGTAAPRSECWRDSLKMRRANRCFPFCTDAFSKSRRTWASERLWPKCCCRAIRVISTCCPRCRTRGPRGASPVCAQGADIPFLWVGAAKNRKARLLLHPQTGCAESGAQFRSRQKTAKATVCNAKTTPKAELYSTPKKERHIYYCIKLRQSTDFRLYYFIIPSDGKRGAIMTSKERLARAMRGQEIDRIPVSPRDGFYLSWKYGGNAYLKTALEAQKEWGHDITVTAGSGMPNPFDSVFFDASYSDDIKLETTVRDDHDTKIIRRVIHTPAGKLEDLIRVAPAGREYGLSPNPVKLEFLIKDRSDLERIRYMMPDPKKCVNLKQYRNDCEALGENGIVQTFIRSPLDHNAGDSRGVENLMTDYYEDPGLFRDILDLFFGHITEETRQCLEQGAEHIFCSWYYSSLSTGWSPEIIREVFVPYMKKHVELVHSYGATYDLYDDGKMMKTLPYYLETGTDVAETLTPPPVGDVDLGPARAIAGDQMTLKGYVDLLYVVQRGTAAQVRAAVIEALEKGSPGGRFILGSSDSFRENTPDENIAAYFKTAREFGSKWI